jgi:hypothetical protein
VGIQKSRVPVPLPKNHKPIVIPMRRKPPHRFALPFDPTPTPVSVPLSLRRKGGSSFANLAKTEPKSSKKDAHFHRSAADEPA